jgi:hypothetical protein
MMTVKIPSPFFAEGIFGFKKPVLFPVRKKDWLFLKLTEVW